MTMTSPVAVARITRDVQDLEDLFDRVAAKKAELVRTISQARIDLGVDAHSVQPALMRLARAEVKLTSGRGDIIRAHSDLYKLGQERGDIPTGPKPLESDFARIVAERAKAA